MTTQPELPGELDRILQKAVQPETPLAFDRKNKAHVAISRIISEEVERELTKLHTHWYGKRNGTGESLNDWLARMKSELEAEIERRRLEGR